VRHSFLPGAEAEYLDAIRFYENRQPGLGAALIAEFEHALGLALDRPHTWRLVHPAGIRRIGLSRFPYAIFFRVVGDALQITAVAHHRKRPGYWLSRIESHV
jgi:toxin ParE1/3/4